MAILKTKELENGVVCEYWKVIKVIHDQNLSMVSVVVDLYLSQVSRENGKLPVVSYSYNWSSSAFANTGEPIADGYINLKLLGEFDGSVDV